MNSLDNGLIAVVKQDCETCALVEPVLSHLAAEGMKVYSQDNPTFPSTVKDVHDDRQLETSFKLEIETVPTVVRIENGNEVGRVVGWVK